MPYYADRNKPKTSTINKPGSTLREGNNGHPKGNGKNASDMMTLSISLQTFGF